MRINTSFPSLFLCLLDQVSLHSKYIFAILSHIVTLNRSEYCKTLNSREHLILVQIREWVALESGGMHLEL